MKTPQEIAQEAAEAFVHVQEYAPYSSRTWEAWPWLHLGGRPTAEIVPHGDLPPVEVERIYREAVARLIEGAIVAHQSQSPVPSPVGDEILAKIRAGTLEAARDPESFGRSIFLGWLCLQQGHLDFLHAVMDGPEAAAIREAEARGRAAGYRAGLEDGRKETKS